MTQTSQQTTAELVKQAAEQISTLVRDELALARRELVDKGKHAGLGAGLFGGGAIAALYGVGALIAAAVLGLANVMPAWLAALIVGFLLLAIAGAQVMVGRSQLRQAVPPAPEQTAQSVRADIDAVTEAVEKGRRR